MKAAARLYLIGIGLLLWFPMIGANAPSPSSEGDIPQIVTGTLINLDLDRSLGTVKTDVGKSLVFKVSKPQLFEKLSVGSRVTLQIDKNGRVDKVTDASVTDFLPPAGPDK